MLLLFLETRRYYKMVAPKVSKSLIVIADTHECTKPNHEIFVGNLQYNISTPLLIGMLQELFMTVNVHVPDCRFMVFQRNAKKKSRKYAFVTVQSNNEEQALYELDGRDKLDYVIEGAKLQVQKRYSERHRQNKRIKISFDGKRRLVVRSKSDPVLGTFKTENVENSTTTTTVIQRKKELFIGQHLPVEDRVTEYKRGSGRYMKNMFIQHVRKYICAFLNSEGMRNSSYLQSWPKIMAKTAKNGVVLDTTSTGKFFSETIWSG